LSIWSLLGVLEVVLNTVVAVVLVVLEQELHLL
jgi:hypothetical protein